MSNGPFDRVKWARDVPLQASNKASEHVKRCVLVILATHTDREWSCYPSVDLVAKETGLGDRAVRYALDDLAGEGLISRQRRSSQKGRTSDLITVNRHHVPLAQPAPRAVSAPPQPASHAPASGTSCTQQPARRAEEGSNDEVSSEVSKQTLSPEGRFALAPLKPPPHKDDIFDEWWSIYPRKVAKEAARRTFESVLRGHRATVDDLMIGAQIYAAARANEDPKFTKHPATWLNGGCWADEPAPVPFPGPMRSREHWSALDQAVAGIRDNEPLTGEAA